MRTIFIKTHPTGKGFYFNLNDIKSYIKERNVVQNLKKFTYNSLLNLNYLLDDECTRTRFERKIRHSISEGKKLSVTHIEYWLRRGYTRKQAKRIISESQKQKYDKVHEKYTPEEITKFKGKSNKGKTKQELRDQSVRCLEYWLKKGFTEEQGREKLREVCDTSLKKMKEKYGKEEGKRRHKEKLEKLSNSLSGKNNPMFGKDSPNKTGSGFSGWYKSYYIRSSYEFFAIKKLERENRIFTVNNNNKFKIELNNNKSYYPDILLPNERKIIEIKPKFRLHWADTQLKKSLTEEKLKSNYIRNYDQYEIWTEDEILFDYKELKKDYIEGNFRIDKNKKNRFEEFIWKS